MIHFNPVVNHHSSSDEFPFGCFHQSSLIIVNHHETSSASSKSPFFHFSTIFPPFFGCFDPPFFHVSDPPQIEKLKAQALRAVVQVLFHTGCPWTIGPKQNPDCTISMCCQSILFMKKSMYIHT